MSTTELSVTGGARRIKDPEMSAMASILRMLQKLDPKARRRVLDFVEARLRSEKEGG